MRNTIALSLLLALLHANAQIDGGWDSAINTGSLGVATLKHMKYTADGSEILFGGDAMAAVYFGSTTLSAPKIGKYAGHIDFLGKINSSTGIPTVLSSYLNYPGVFTCITTDDSGNFYVGGSINSATPFDLGNGVSISGLNKMSLAKFDNTGKAIWAKSYIIGVEGSFGINVLKLAVSSSNNIFLWAQNPNKDANGKTNYPLFKFDNSGTIIWKKDAFNPLNSVGNVANGYSTDQFIDNDENIHLFVLTGAGFTFDGVAYPLISSYNRCSTIISLNSSGTVTKAQTFDGNVEDFQVNRSTGNIVFNWTQLNPNGEPFINLPHPLAVGPAYYANAFQGIVAVDKDFNFIKAKDISSTVDNPFIIESANLKFLALPNGKMLYATSFIKNEPYSVGIDYQYALDANLRASVIIETDTDWKISKFITGGKANVSSPNYLIAYNDTYAMNSSFFTSEVPPATLPTTSYGNLILTGFNAAPDLTTAYGIYSTYPSNRGDIAVVQTKSSNFPTTTTTAVKRIESSADVKLYPNPATTNLYLKLPNTVENGALKITSLTGQAVIERQNLKGVDFNLDVNKLTPGFYLLECRDGNLKYKNKFLKQ